MKLPAGKIPPDLPFRQCSISQITWRAAVIGEVLPSPRKRLIVRKDGREEELARPAADHLWLALER